MVTKPICFFLTSHFCASMQQGPGDLLMIFSLGFKQFHGVHRPAAVAAVSSGGSQKTNAGSVSTATRKAHGLRRTSQAHATWKRRSAADGNQASPPEQSLVFLSNLAQPCSLLSFSCGFGHAIPFKSAAATVTDALRPALAKQPGARSRLKRARI